MCADLSNVVVYQYDTPVKSDDAISKMIAELYEFFEGNKDIPIDKIEEDVRKTVCSFKKEKVSYADVYSVFCKSLINHMPEEEFFRFIYNHYHNYINQSFNRSVNGILVMPKVKRRNGEIVPFLEHKIYSAILRGFESVGVDIKNSLETINDLVDEIKLYVSRYNKDVINLEDIQDIVIYTLIKNNFKDVAKSYILYRASRAEHRNIEVVVPEGAIEVIEPNNTVGYVTDQYFDELYNYASEGLDLDLDKDSIIKNLKRSMYNGMSKQDFKKVLVMNAKAMMERGYDYSLFAGRVLLSHIYQEILGWHVSYGEKRLKNMHRKLFKEYVYYAVKNNLLDSRILKYDLDKLAKSIDPKYDKQFTYLGIQTLYDRYLLIERTKDYVKRLEVPQFFWMRVAMGLFINELEKGEPNVEDLVIELYDYYRRRLFCSSTPTLFNSGTNRPQLSSCYLYVVDDSIESIMEMGIAKAAYLSKWAGGLGGSWTHVRGSGAVIKGTQGKSNGVIPFLKIHNDMLVAVNQGGKRQGSGAVYLEPWHSDIFEFLELRRNTGDERRRTHDTNTALWIPDLFMKRVYERKHWTLFHSNEVRDLHETYGQEFEKRYEYYERLYEEGKIWGKRVEALELWKQMLKMLFETGHPWMCFKDPCNIRSPQSHVGVIHSSNLCTEITLNTSKDEIAVCNLGSLVLPNFVDDNGNVDYKLLKKVIRLAVRVLDNVIDINFYPVEEARNANMRHRAVGLGVMGWHDFLLKKNINFDSEEAVELADQIMEYIAYEAYSASSDLAVVRGPYSTFKGSKWSNGILPIDSLDLLEKERGRPINVNRNKRLDWDSLRKKIISQGMRNSNVLAIAPTATISNIMGTSPSIEPYFSNMYVKSNISGDFIVVNRFMEKDLRKLGLWNERVRNKIKYFDGDLSMIDEVPEDIKRKYKTAFQVGYESIIKQAAYRQKWIDQSQSINLFLDKNDMKTLSHMYKYAWEMGLKTTYYLRTLGATRIEKSTVDIRSIQSNDDNNFDANTYVAPSCRIGDEGCESCQ